MSLLETSTLTRGSRSLNCCSTWRGQGRRTLIVVTHDEHLAQRGDRLLRIEDGMLSS